MINSTSDRFAKATTAKMLLHGGASNLFSDIGVFLFAVFLPMLLFVHPLEAGILVGGTNAHGLIQGTTSPDPNNTNPDLGTVVADVDWSVFAPGTAFQDFLSDNGLALAEGFSATNYTYVYQLFNINTQDDGFGGLLPPSDVDLLQMTVQTDIGDPLVGSAPGWLSSAVGDVLPLESNFAGTTPSSVTSAVWNFFDSGGPDTLPNGEQSGLLFFASPVPPEFASVTVVSGGGFSVEDDPDNGLTGVPSPGIPEPSSVVLATILAAGMTLARRR